VTLEGIDSVDDFVGKLDRIEPPGQLVSLLTDPLLQKYVDLKPSPVNSMRIGLWLATCLEEQFEAARSGTGDDRYLSEVLDGLLKYGQYTKVSKQITLTELLANIEKSLHPIILAFLREYLPIWNGHDNVDTILGILSYIEFEPAEDVYLAYLRPVEQALAAHGISAYVKLVHFYTSLLQREVSAIASKAALRDNRYQQTVNNLVEHAATMFTSAVLSVPSGSSTSLTSSVLSFYELLSKSSKPPIIPIMLPPMHLVYLLAQDASSTTLSRICGIIASYKTAFDNHPKPVKTYYSAEVTDAFNYCLRDIYNLVWVARGLHIQDQKSKGLYCNAALRSALNSYLSKVDREYAIGTALRSSRLRGKGMTRTVSGTTRDLSANAAWRC
jgi:centromere protein I